MSGGCAHVDRARRSGRLRAADQAAVSEIPLGGRIADQGAAVDLRRQRRGLQDAGDLEPPVSQPNSLVGVDPVDAQAFHRDRTKHRGRLAGGARVQPTTPRDAGPEHGQQVQARGSNLEATAPSHRDHRVPIDPLFLQQGGVCHLLDVIQVTDPCRCFAWQLRLATREALSGLHGEQVRAEPVDLREQPGLR